MPGEMLYQVTDLSSVWVIADLSEQDIGLVKSGAKARVTTTAYPNEAFEGRITYIYPTLKAETRSIPVRYKRNSLRLLLFGAGAGLGSPSAPRRTHPSTQRHT